MRAGEHGEARARRDVEEQLDLGRVDPGDRGETPGVGEGEPATGQAPRGGEENPWRVGEAFQFQGWTVTVTSVDVSGDSGTAEVDYTGEFGESSTTWDLVDEDRRYLLDREIDLQLSQLQWAPRVNISAKTGRAVQKLVPALETSLASWDKRITTGQLNTFLKEVVAATPPPVRGGKQPRILFATQATARPPTFVLFTTGFLEAGYRRFLERRLRETFGFEGSPIRINVRVREKRGAKR